MIIYLIPFNFEPNYVEEVPECLMTGYLSGISSLVFLPSPLTLLSCHVSANPPFSRVVFSPENSQTFFVKS